MILEFPFPIKFLNELAPSKPEPILFLHPFPIKLHCPDAVFRVPPTIVENPADAEL